MLLTVRAKGVPQWWLDSGLPVESEKEFTSLKLWWDGLSWQEFQGPLDKIYYNCGGAEDLVGEAACYADVGAQMVSQTFGIEWLYKMIANASYQAKMGVIREAGNISDFLNNVFPGPSLADFF